MSPSALCCTWEGCTGVPVGRSPLCPLHRLARKVHSASVPVPHHPEDQTVDAGPYSRWVKAVMDARAVVYDDLTVSGLSQRSLSRMTGISKSVISDLCRGERAVISRPSAVTLDPWVYGTHPGAGTRTRMASTGTRIPDAHAAARLPRGSVMLDRYGRAWQMGHHRWGTGMDLDLKHPSAPSWPCRLLYVPPPTWENKKVTHRS